MVSGSPSIALAATLPLALSSLSASITRAPRVASLEGWVRSSSRARSSLLTATFGLKRLARHVTQQAVAQLAGGGAFVQVLLQIGGADEQLAAAYAALPDQPELAVGVPIVNRPAQWGAGPSGERPAPWPGARGHDFIPLPVLEELRWGTWPGRGASGSQSRPSVWRAWVWNM